MSDLERQQLLLTRGAVPELMAALHLKLDSTFATDMYRALEQANLRLKQAKSGMAKG